MKLSSRLAWGVPPNAIARRLDDRRARGEPLFDLTQSNPTDAGIAYPASIFEGLRAALAGDAALRYRPDPQGDLAARRAIADYYAARGEHVDPARLLLTASTSEAYAWLFKLLCDPGDAVLVPSPSYPLFEYLGALESVSLAPYTLGFDGHWFLDERALAETLARTPRARAILCVHPNNPTGSFLSSREIDALVTLAHGHRLPLICDEVFLDYAFAERDPDARSLLREIRVPIFCLSGLSKVVGLPQVKLGWIHVGGPGAEEALARLELIADTYLSVSAPAQLAAPSLLAHAREIQSTISSRTRANLARLDALIADTAITRLPVAGGWYATLRLPNTQNDEAWTLALLDAGVVVQPGYFYDFEDECVIVVSLLTPEAIFDEGIARLRSLVDHQ